jgi:hypothetical protein
VCVCVCVCWGWGSVSVKLRAIGGKIKSFVQWRTSFKAKVMSQEYFDSFVVCRRDDYFVRLEGT